MITVKVDTSLFTSEHPTEEGQYLWLNSMGMELINVTARPARIEYGIEWEATLTYNGRSNIKQLQGKFMKLERE